MFDDSCLHGSTSTVSLETTLLLTTTSCSDDACITLAPVSSEIEYSLTSLVNSTTPVTIPTATAAKGSNMFNTTSSSASATKTHSIEEMSENEANMMSSKNLISIVGAAIMAAFL
ncbi:unnamed protein product [Hanseniaspora opuntiae]